MRAGCYEGLPAEAKQALEDAENLRRRLERLVLALALGSELASELLRSAAESADFGEGKSERMLLLSRRSEEHAQLYRGIARQLSRHPA